MPDRINLRIPEVAMNIKELVKTESADLEGRTTIAHALKRAMAEANGEPLGLMKNKYLRFWYKPTTFGPMAQWLCEVAGSRDLDKVLKHADQYMGPAWKDGGLYYQRQDEGWDAEGIIFMSRRFRGMWQFDMRDWMLRIGRRLCGITRGRRRRSTADRGLVRLASRSLTW